MKKTLRVALGFGNSYQPMLKKNVKQPVPVVYIANSIASVDGLFNQEEKIYGTPKEYFTLKYREIFTNTKQKGHDKERGKGMAGWTKHEYWPQQLNFALWCATTSCGVPPDICCRQIYHSNVDPLVLHWYIL